MKVPMKMVPIATSKGITTSLLLQPNWPCRGLLNTLHAYTAPIASCTSTAATTMPHRPLVGFGGSCLDAVMMAPRGVRGSGPGDHRALRLQALPLRQHG